MTELEQLTKEVEVLRLCLFLIGGFSLFIFWVLTGWLGESRNLIARLDAKLAEHLELDERYERRGKDASVQEAGDEYQDRGYTYE